MILLQALAIAILVGVLRGGRPSQLMLVPLRWPALPLFASAAQFLVVRLGDGQRAAPDLLAGILLLSNLALLLMVWVNRHIPGMALLGVGLILNLVVMLANGGAMPISPETMARIGAADPAALLGTRVLGCKSVLLLLEQTQLWFLSDVLVLPPPFALSAFSAGDVLIAWGVFEMVQWVLLAPLAGRTSPGRPATVVAPPWLAMSRTEGGS